MEKQIDKKRSMTRKQFLGNAAFAAAGLTVLPSYVISGLGYKAPSDKLNIAGIGVGGRGAGVLRGLASENIVALCDVDWRHAEGTFKEYPNAKRYWDWRLMLDEMDSSIDAVMVATSDHTHAIIGAHAMTLGKHVYMEKPLTHTVYESRLLTRLAEKHKVATQMGNQGASEEGVSKICEWIWNGEIGEVKKVEAFTNRPTWPQGVNTPSDDMSIPSTLNWDMFIGPANMRPYHVLYTPWNFRGWWDFGTGALGDMACHILHPVFKGLILGYPTKVKGSSSLLFKDSCPASEIVHLTFPQRASKGSVDMPEVDVTWYDGGLKPREPEGWPAGKDMNDSGGGVIFHGTKDTLVCGCYGRNPFLISGRIPNVPESFRRIEHHGMDWVRACKESPAGRVETASPFSEAGPFNEMVVMGVLAVRLQELHKVLEWDGPNMKFTNISDADTVRMVIEDRMVVREDGRPRSQKTWTERLNAKEFAENLIKHEYRKGWSLPAMV
jgi:predicted dehydrogenase